MIRIKKRWRQEDLARAAGVSERFVSKFERGQLGDLDIATVLAITSALGARVDFVLRWNGGDLDRLINARHSALHEAVARYFQSLPEWQNAPEVSFAIYGERGVIDILAWHAATRTLLVIELKTEIVDVNNLMGRVDVKRRLAAQVARDRGWDPMHIGVWVIVADSSTNRRRLRQHSSVLRTAFPTDGRSIKGWLKRPDESIACLSFWSKPQQRAPYPAFASVKRVRRARRRSNPVDSTLDATA